MESQFAFNSAKLFFFRAPKIKKKNFEASNAINNVSLQIFLNVFALDDAHAPVLPTFFLLFIRGFSPL
jgi:hypothetical protein